MKDELFSLVIQSFGRENEYKRAILTILSFYAHSSLPTEQTRVLLFTDQPGYFAEFLRDLPVEFILLTPEKIKSMRGEIDFLHRMKIAVIEEAFALSKGPLFYADSDCFFIADPKPVLQQVSEQRAFMHLTEYAFVKEIDDPTETYENFYGLINRQQFRLTDGSLLKVTEQHSSWNAGVMVFHPSHARFIPDVYFLTDQFYPSTRSHASEQYAFSLVMQQNLELQPCDHIVYHYWYRVKKKIIDDYLNAFTRDWALQSLTKKKESILAWTAMFPSYLEKHIYTKKDNAIQNFNLRKFKEGFKWTAIVVKDDAFRDRAFFKDVLYHTKQMFKRK